MARSLLFTLLTILVLNGILFVMVDLVDQIKYQPLIKQWQTQQKNQIDSWLKDDQFYRGHELFAPPNTRLADYDPTFRSTLKNDWPILKPDNRQKILALGKHWLDKKILLSETEPLQSFFIKSLDFNSWSLKSSDFESPSFKIIDFVVMGQALLNHTRWQAEASLESPATPVRHFARLLISTEHFDFNRAGLSLLEKELEFLADLALKGRKLDKLSQLLSKEDIKRLRLYYDRISSALNPINSPENLELFFTQPQLPLGFCAAFHKKREAFSWSEAYLKPSFLFETSFKEQFKNWQQIEDKAQSHCTLQEDTLTDMNHSWVRFLPFYRRVYAYQQILKLEGFQL